MLRLEHVNKSYRLGGQPLHVLKDINLEILAGEFVAIMGTSGSGKSTLLNILGILDNYDSGTYTLGGRLVKDLSQTKGARYRNELIGFVFQHFNLLSFKTAQENVALPLYYQKVPRRRRNTLALEYLDKMGLADRAQHSPSELSGGQKQRVAIARALISQPKIILADEPTGALDSATSDEVMALFRQLNREGMTIVMVTHENDVAAQAQRIIRLKDGVVQPPDALAHAPAPTLEPALA